LSTQNRHFTAAATAFPKSGRGHSLELSIDQLLDATAFHAGGLPQIAALSTQNRHLAAAATALPESSKFMAWNKPLEEFSKYFL
jgi:hypothetical protein